MINCSSSPLASARACVGTGLGIKGEENALPSQEKPRFQIYSLFFEGKIDYLKFGAPLPDNTWNGGALRDVVVEPKDVVSKLCSSSLPHIQRNTWEHFGDRICKGFSPICC